MHFSGLGDSPQIKITEEIKRIASFLRGQSDRETAKNIIRWIKENLKLKRLADLPNPAAVFRRRTADQIIRDGFATGCADAAIVFIALARALGIPSIYCELVVPEKGNFGHAWAKCYLDGAWVDVDPMGGTIGEDVVKKFSKFGKVYVLGKGADSWDIGIESWEDFLRKVRELG